MHVKRHRYALLLAVWVTSSTLGGQDAKKPAGGALDQSSEAYVVEESSDRWSFENDGTDVHEATVRLRLQSDAGVQQLGLLTFPYQQANQAVQLEYVRVRKPGGSTVVTPLDDLQDMPQEVTRAAPFYSDLREKQLAVKALSVGDVLEYRCRWNTTKPLIPGQFWMEFEFPRDEVILSQTLQVSVPRNRPVNFKSTLAPVITEDGQRQMYTWTRSNLENHQERKSELADRAIHGKFPIPDVQLSSFQTWKDVGGWYDGLQRERLVPSVEIRTKAAELTRNAVDDAGKVQAIYKYVSTQYRYIGVAFGIGRYQPHSAAEVLSNQYGDCKDKHTLLASLLSAAGIPAYAALINSSHLIEPSVPSPAQFDHLITVVPMGKDLLWLDSTTEVGPLGYLVPQLRGKQALVIFPDKPADFLTTAVNPPFPTSWTFKINARLDDSGTLEGKVEQTVRGDLEVIWRTALRRAPRAQWKDVIQNISYGIGFAGEVSDVTASMPEAIETPLHIAYTYKRKDYPDWKDHRISPPAPGVFPSPVEEDQGLPRTVWLGAPGGYQFESRVELPKGYMPELPANKDLINKFAEYHSTYSYQGNVLVGGYRIVVKAPDISGDAVGDYKTMAEKVGKDRNQLIPIFSQQARFTGETLTSLIGRVWEMPGSSDPKAIQLEQDARNAADRGSIQTALGALNQAVTQDPKFTRGWLLLGTLSMVANKPDSGIDAYRRAIAIDPTQPLPHKLLAVALVGMARRAEAIKAWQDLGTVAPQDRDVAANLGLLLLAEKRFAEATPHLESLVQLYPQDASWLVRLGSAQLQGSDAGKAAGAFARALQIQPDAETHNAVAYALADANKQLDDALRYAQSAVHEEEEASRKVQLTTLTLDDLKHTLNLGAYWDTLGWVWYRKGDLKLAEGYLYAAWTVRQDAVVGCHLAQVYERQQRRQDTVRMYRMAADFRPAVGEEMEAVNQAKKRLETLISSASRRNARSFVDSPGGEMSQERTVVMPKLVAGEASAEFFIAVAPGPKVEETKFVSGSDSLRSAGQTLSQSRLKVSFPEGSSGRLVRRGVLACYRLTGCSFVMIPVELVRSVD